MNLRCRRIEQARATATFSSVVLFLMALFSALILADESAFTRVWHIASENFNREGTDSTMWVNYQLAYSDPGNPLFVDGGKYENCAGGPPSDDYGMTFSFRFRLWLLTLGGLVATTLWEKVVVSGRGRDWFVENHPPAYIRNRVQLAL